jgi:RNA polymerase sigma factor for flagellar operon FliA
MTECERVNLIESHKHLVQWIVRKAKFDDKPLFDHKDMMSFGNMGLVKAADTFNPGRNVKFSTWARVKIFGEILEGKRRTLGDPRTKAVQCENAFKTCSLDALVDSSSAWLDIFPDPNVNLEQEIMASWEAEQVRQAISKLPERWQKIVRMYYFDDMNYKTIGKALGICETRVYQIVHQSYDKMRPELVCLQ